MNTLIEKLFLRHARHLALTGLFLIPLKLSLSYLCLIPLTVLWLYFHRKTLFERVINNSLFVPFLFFVIALTLSALFGINLSRSLPAAPTLLFYGCLILVFHDLARNEWHSKFLLSLIVGQSIAALHSVIEGAYPSVPRLFLGKVTESGQLALTLMCAISLVTLLSSEKLRTSISTAHAMKLWGVANTALFTCVGFLSVLARTSPFELLIVTLALCSFSISAWISWGHLTRGRPVWSESFSLERCIFFLYTIAVPLLISAVLLNLKRGPWAGLLCGSTVFLFLHARRWLWPVLIVAALSVISIQPIRTRLLESSQDFFIAGGRSVIWQVGAELSTRYPLGIGFRNSPVLQKFSQDIPPELKHFHNNILNILVETGWVACALFLWWIARALRTAFSYPLSGQNHVLVFGLGCALVSWQVAGLVEYNVGDSEVLCIALILMGILSRLSESGRVDSIKHSSINERSINQAQQLPFATRQGAS